jgi:hypothetical protein
MYFSAQFHPHTLILWPAVAIMAVAGECEACRPPQLRGSCITLSFLIWSASLTWEDRA